MIRTSQNFHRVNPTTVLQMAKVNGFKVKQWKMGEKFYLTAEMIEEYVTITFFSSEYIQEVLDRKEVTNEWEQK